MFLPSRLSLHAFACSKEPICTNACSPWAFSKTIALRTSPYLLKTQNKTSAVTGYLLLVMVMRRTGDGLLLAPNLSFSILDLVDGLIYTALSLIKISGCWGGSRPSPGLESESLALWRCLNSTKAWFFWMRIKTFSIWPNRDIAETSSSSEVS